MHIDEINAVRIQEEVEREWRRKEKEEVMKKLEVQKLLWKEREEQINSKRIIQANEIERNRREFEKIVREQETAFCREKKELEHKQQQALIHHNEILEQVCIIHFHVSCEKCFINTMICENIFYQTCYICVCYYR